VARMGKFVDDRSTRDAMRERTTCNPQPCAENALKQGVPEREVGTGQ